MRAEALKAKGLAASADSSSGSKDRNKKQRSEVPASGSKRPINGKDPGSKDTRPPIIIVPSALSGIISSMNAADFLENSTYITIEEKRKIGAPREKERLISRDLGAVRSKYLLVDSPKLSPKDWERVVAVFATGQAWQFKDWPPGYSNPVELFSKVRGGVRREVVSDKRS